MGLSIHFKGLFKSPEKMPAMIEEVKDACTVFQWKYNIFDTTFETITEGDEYTQDIAGIVFTPTGCEPVFLTFTSNLKLTSYVNFSLFGKYSNDHRPEHLHHCSVKTQYAGLPIHVQVIHLLRHISGKYFADFTLMDEGEYWETNDVKVLEKNFVKYNAIVDQFALAAECLAKNQGETFEEYIVRIAEEVKKHTDQA